MLVILCLILNASVPDIRASIKVEADLTGVLMCDKYDVGTLARCSCSLQLRVVRSSGDNVAPIEPGGNSSRIGVYGHERTVILHLDYYYYLYSYTKYAIRTDNTKSELSIERWRIESTYCGLCRRVDMHCCASWWSIASANIMIVSQSIQLHAIVTSAKQIDCYIEDMSSLHKVDLYGSSPSPSTTRQWTDSNFRTPLQGHTPDERRRFQDEKTNIPHIRPSPWYENL